MKGDLSCFVNGWDVGCARKVKGDSRAFGLSTSEMALGRRVGGAGLGGIQRAAHSGCRCVVGRSCSQIQLPASPSPRCSPDTAHSACLKHSSPLPQISCLTPTPTLARIPQATPTATLCSRLAPVGFPQDLSVLPTLISWTFTVPALI